MLNRAAGICSLVTKLNLFDGIFGRQLIFLRFRAAFDLSNSNFTERTSIFAVGPSFNAVEAKPVFTAINFGKIFDQWLLQTYTTLNSALNIGGWFQLSSFVGARAFALVFAAGRRRNCGALLQQLIYIQEIKQ